MEGGYQNRLADEHQDQFLGAVGAEDARIIGAPAIAHLCTISTETRDDSTTAPPAGSIPARAIAPISLSSALCSPTS